MAFESVQIVSTRNGSSSSTGTYREDLLQGEVIGLSLSSMVGVTSVLWEIIGRPEFSAAGGAGPEPVSMGISPTASFTVDSDAGAVHKDGTYLVRATINPGSPGQVRKTCALARVSGLTIAGASGARTLRKPGGFEGLEDTSSPTCSQGYGKMENRWFELLRSIAIGGGVIETLAGAYAVGSVAADQTILLNNGNGGGVVIDGSSGGFTGASALRVNTAAGGPVVVDRATGNVGVGIAAPLSSVHAKGTAPAVRLDRTGGVAFDLANVTDTLSIINRTSATTLVTIPATGGLRSDLGLSVGAAPATGPALAMGAGSTAAISTANTGRIRYNEITQQWETSTNGGAYVAFGSGAGTFVEMDGIATGTAQLSAFTPPTTGHVEAVVKSVRDVFYLDRTSALTADGITVVTALGGGRWIRRCFSDPFWWLQADWGIDPAGTFGTPGNDEAAGDASHPIKSMAEWRRRIRGAAYGTTGSATTVVIHALSSSANQDDGYLYGYTCVGSTANVIIMAAPTVIGSGTLTGAVAYSGNNRGTVTNSALPVSWASSYGLSGVGGSRYIRKVGAAVQAQILPVETVAKTVMIGLPTDTSETSTGIPTANTAAFSPGDNYEVVSRFTWPQLVSGVGARAQLQCLDVTPQGLVTAFNSLHRYVLCGFLASYTAAAGNVLAYNCLFASICVSQPTMSFGPFACSFLSTCEMIGTADWAGTENVFVGANAKLDNHHGGIFEGLGTLHFFDNTGTTINLDRGAAVASGTVVGSGNTGKLITVNNGSYYYPGASLTSTTTDALPYVVAGTAYAAPRVDQRAGCGIYNGTAQFLVPDAVDNQAAVPLHQVVGLIASGGPTFTPGSVIFAAPTTGVLAQDNANFFWDSANIRLGIGTAAAPATSIHAKAATPALRLDRTGGVAFDISNVTDTLSIINRTSATTLVTIPSTGGLRSDFGIGIGTVPSTSATIAMGAGSAAAVSAANTGRIRYNEVAQQWETSTNGGAYVAFGSGTGTFVELDSINTTGNKLSAYAFPASGHVEAVVATVRDVFYLDRTSTLTADGITVVTALGGTGRWIRRQFSDPFWQAVTSWGIDPAQTFGTPGNDEAVGSPSAPLKSMAEWRRRVRGAIYLSNVTIKVLSSSTNVDDGIIEGVSTPSLTVFITVFGTPTVLFSGTVSSYQAYSGNTRGTFVDTALTSWTASGGISTSAGGGRFVRRQGSGARPYGPLLKDMGSKTVMFDVLGNWDETAVTGVASLPSEVNLSNGDTYEVVSMPSWPYMQPRGNVNIRQQCLEVLTRQIPGVAAANLSTSGVLTHVLCSFGRALAVTAFGNGLRFYSTVFTAPSPEGLGSIGSSLIFAHCAFSGTILELSGFGSTFTGSINVHVNSELRFWHGNTAGSVGEWRSYDTAFPLISVRHDSTVNLVGAIKGEGNSGALVNCDTAGILYGAENISATTSSGLPYTISGIGYAAPKVDARTGDAVYNRTTPAQFLITDAVDAQAAVPLHQVNALISAGTGGGSFTQGSVIFAGVGGGITQDNANFFWDTTNHRLGIGGVPGSQVALDIIQSSTLTVAARISNSNASTTAAAVFNASNLTATAAFGITGTNWVEPGGSTLPNRVANQTFITTALAGPAPSIYIGSHGTFTIQTGATQAERLRILQTGEVRLSNLAAGGLVRAAGTTGQLGIGLVTAADITDQNVLMTKLEPIGASKILGYDGGTGPTGSPFDISVIAPIKIPNGSGQLVFDTGFIQGSVIFQGATQIAQDNASFFWNATNHRLGIGTNVPLQDLDVSNTSDVITTVQVRNTGSGTHGQAQFVATSSPGGGLGIAVGVAGPSFVATAARPGVIANSPYIVPHFGSSTIYMGASNTLVFATGNPTETTRLQILSGGQINVSSLNAGGVVTSAVTTGQLGVITMVAGQVPFGAASGGGLSQDAALFWSSGTHRLGIGTASPGGDVHVFRNSGNTFTNVVVETGGTTSGYGAALFAANTTGTVGLFGATGSGYVDPGANPNLHASTTFVLTNNSNPLYLGASGDVTVQTGATAAERLRVFATGETTITGPLGVNANARTQAGGPYLIAALASGNADKLLFLLNGGASVTGSGGAPGVSLSYCEWAASSVFFNGGNLNDLSQMQIDAPAFISSGSTTIVNDLAATLLITGAPNMAGGHWSLNTGQSWALAVKAGDVLINNNLTVNGTIGIGGSTLFAGTNNTFFGSLGVQGPIGFFSQTPAVKQTVTGSKASGAAWASLLGALVTYGLVIDSTSP